MATQQPLRLDSNIPVRDDERMILVTAHRRESLGSDFEAICHGLRQIADANKDVNLVYPVHLNPNVRAPVFKTLGGHPRIHLLDPLPYPQFTHLLMKCYFVITDSGGIQEEAPTLGKPVLVMRKTTERQEAIEAGTARLVGVEASSIYSAAQELLDNRMLYEQMANAQSPFGDGTPGQQIVRVLDQCLETRSAEVFVTRSNCHSRHSKARISQPPASTRRNAAIE